MECGERSHLVLQAMWKEAVRLIGVHTVLLMAERILWDLQAVYPEAADIRFGFEGWDLEPLLARPRGPEVAARMVQAFLTLYSNLMGEASARELERRVQQALAGGDAGKGA